MSNKDIGRFKFFYQEQKIIEYDRNKTVESLLVEFLRQTNSKIELAIEKINFLYHSKIINKKDILPKQIKDVFKGEFAEFPIKVMKDLGNIIGGNII